MAKLKQSSNAPFKLHVFFLRPNLEGLLHDIRRCDPMLLPESMEAALRKKIIHRDLVLSEVGKAARKDIRNGVRKLQVSLDALIKEIASTILPAVIA